MEATEAFYKMKAPQYLHANGVQNYMRYADAKLREEELRAHKYLESCSGSVQLVRLLHEFSVCVRMKLVHYKCIFIIPISISSSLSAVLMF